MMSCNTHRCYDNVNVMFMFALPGFFSIERIITLIIRTHPSYILKVLAFLLGCFLFWYKGGDIYSKANDNILQDIILSFRIWPLQ